MQLKPGTQPLKIIFQAGYTLLEITTIVLILGIMAAVVIPDFSSTDSTRLDTIAEDIANAIRYTRSESIRQGKPYGFKQISSTRLLKIGRVDTSTTPWSLIYDVYHPLYKKFYRIELDNHPIDKTVTVIRTPVFIGSCNSTRKVYFDSRGTPHCLQPENILVEKFDLKLTLGTQSKVVTLHGLSGKVSIQ